MRYHTPTHAPLNRFIPLAWVFMHSFAAVSAQTAWDPATRAAVPEIRSAGLTPAGFRLEMCAPPGDYTVERSTDLLPASWLGLGPIVPSSGIGQMTDAGALALPSAFYRIAGGFQETPMKLVTFDSSVISGGIVGAESFGGLWTGHSREELRFQSANPATGLIKHEGGRFASFRMEPTNPGGVVAAVVEQWHDVDPLPVTMDANQWVVSTETGDLNLLKLEGGDHSILGLAHDTNLHQESGAFGVYQSTEKESRCLWGIAKSSNANPADLAGDWGFVRILVDGVASDGVYNGEAWTTSIASGPNPRPLAVATFTEFDIEHAWPSGTVEWVFDTRTHTPPVGVSLHLDPDGSVALIASEGSKFEGMVSPSAKLLVATASVPSLPAPTAGDTYEFLPDLDAAVTEWLVGVKRAKSPQLGGKAYRVIRQGWWVEGDWFEVERSGVVDRLVFNAGGTAATRTADFIFDGVSFAGELGSDADSVTLAMSVSVDAEGKIQLEGGVPGDFLVRSFGFAQEGSNLLILIDSNETEEGGAGLGLMIAVREP